MTATSITTMRMKTRMMTIVTLTTRILTIKNLFRRRRKKYIIIYFQETEDKTATESEA